MIYSAIPRREIASGILSSVVFLMGYYVAQYAILESIIAGISSLVGFRLTFGTDMTLSEMFVNVKGLPPEVANQLLATATHAISRIKAVNKTIPDRSLSALLDDITEKGSTILTELQNEPQKLITAQRFITVYLDGAATVSEKFSNVYGRSQDKEGELKNFSEFLAQTSDTFDKQQKALINDDKFDLDVEISVLKKRMTQQI